MKVDDKYYSEAAENAKEDWFLLGIKRIEREVELQAQKLREKR